MSEEKTSKTEKTFHFIVSPVRLQHIFKQDIIKAKEEYRAEGWIVTSNPNEVAVVDGALVAHLKFHRQIK